jgi:hypothetical protein
MTDLDQALADVFADLADAAPHDPALAARVRRRARRRVLLPAGVLVAASAIVVAGVVASRPHDTFVRVASAPACDGTVTTGVLPVWARDGFSDPEPVARYVPSRSGNVVAILFGTWSPSAGGGTEAKVLWAWKDAPVVAPGAPVRMSAQLDGTGPTVTDGLPQPYGPSSVRLPSSGCWRITISSPGRTDTLDLDTRR